jgi:glutamate-5-semialdehyde dehydrogenase
MITSSYSEIFARAKSATRFIAGLSDATIQHILNDIADAILTDSEIILTENQKDVDRMDPSDPKLDRLRLTSDRLNSIAGDVRRVAQLPSPLNLTLEETSVPSGLHLVRKSVPLGVVGMVYESRPNVTIDVAALCLKSGNVAVLKGGSDASFSNAALVNSVHQVLATHHIDPSVVTLLPPTREATQALFQAVGVVDVVIPRGSQALIDAVRRESRVPVIETGAGIVHTYVDSSADIEKSSIVITNAKTRRVSVCNALDCLLVHTSNKVFLQELVSPLASSHVIIFADSESYDILISTYPNHLLHPAEPEHFGTEFLDYKLAVKIVSGLDEALDHIRTHSSGHSEAILTEDSANAQRFLNEVDAAAVYVNASTAFTDGGEFGMGAEIGISTQKLHARGPMGLAALTSSKWIVTGDYSVR